VENGEHFILNEPCWFKWDSRRMQQFVGFSLWSLQSGFPCACDITCVYACECSPGTWIGGQWMEYGGERRESLLARAENEVLHLSGVYTI